MRIAAVLLLGILATGCDGDEQEADVEQVEHAAPAPMPASPPADTTGQAAGATTDTVPRTTTH